MKVVALSDFRDLDNFTKAYVKGTSYEMPDTRAEKLIDLGLVQAESNSSTKGDVDLASREAAAVAREAKLVSREAEFEKLKSALASREAEVIAEEAKLVSREAEFEKLKSALTSREAEVVAKTPESKSKK